MEATVRNFAITFIAFFVLISVYSYYIEPYNLQITENHFDFFDGSGKPVKIVLISDIQTAYNYPEYFHNAIVKINEQKPDIILLAGDIVNGEVKEWMKIDELKNLKSKNGIFAVLGNHDYRDWDCTNPQNYEYADNVEKKLESFGIDVLRNENRIFNINNREFAIVGLDDQLACRLDQEKAMKNLNENTPKIILVHEQEGSYNLSITSKTIVFAGHTHCGQLYFPFVTDFVIEEMGFGKIRQGYAISQNNIETYVTCGITPGGIRLFARPEISVIYLD